MLKVIPTPIYLEAEKPYRVESYGSVGFTNPQDSGATATLTVNGGAKIVLPEGASVSLPPVNALTEIDVTAEYSTTPTSEVLMIYNVLKNCNV